MHPHADLQLKAVVLLALGHFTVDFFAGFVAPVVPILRQDMGLSLTEAAFLISSFTLSSTLAQTAFGFLSDRLTNARLTTLAPLLAGVTVSCIGLMPSYPALVAGLIVAGLSVAAFHPEGAALAGLKSGRRHSVGMSIFVTGGILGIGVGALAASLIVETGGLKALPYAMFLAIPTTLLIWRKMDYRPSAPAQRSHRDIKVRPRYGLLVGLAAMATTRALIIFGYYAFVPLYLTQRGTSVSTVGWTLFIFAVGGGLGGLTGGYWAERIGERKLLYVSFLLPIPLLCGYLLLGTSVTGLLCLGLAGYSISTGVPLVLSITQRSFPARVGTMSSVVMGLSWGTAGLGITPAGAIAETVGIYPILWGFSLIGLFGFSVAVLLFRRILPPTRNLAQPEPVQAAY